MIDLSVGHPACLEPYWKGTELGEYDGTYSIYPDPDGNTELISQIKQLHSLYNNIPNAKDYQVVIGNGASQVMQAAIASFEDNYVPTSVYAHPPYFPRFPKFVDFSGRKTFTFSNELWKTEGNRTIEIITMPNNPDNENSRGFTSSDWKIYDCSYLWPQYTVGSIRANRPEIVVFSLAKALGLASVRIGWALVYEQKTAEKMRKFIETQGGGVSLPAQQMAAALIDGQIYLGREGEETAVKRMGDILASRWQEINALKFGSYELINRSGMFLWIRCPESADLLDATLQIKSAHGPDFGVGREYARINLACSEKDYRFLLDGLTKLQ